MPDTENKSALFVIPPNVSNKDIAQIIIDEWRDSQTIEDMRTANEYYLCRNTAIQKKNRDYKDEAGNVRSNDTVSNAKIPSAFLRTSVNQKINYALGKPFVINVEAIDAEDKARQDDPIAEEYLKQWQGWITPYVRKTIKRIAKWAVVGGIGWGYGRYATETGFTTSNSRRGR
jgi:hypothetical protein